MVADNEGRSFSGHSFAPGDHVRWFAEKMGWPIRRHNILVEGNDSAYFEFAAGLYQRTFNRDLLSQIAIFPTGDGEAGGTYGILRHFPTFRSIIETDVDVDGGRQFQAIVLLDSDSAGKNARNGLTAKYTNYLENRDVFLLQRKLPRTTCDPSQLGRAIAKENAEWKSLDCEIEDLLSIELLETFVEGTSRAMSRDPVRVSDGHHFEFNDGVKPELLRFVRDFADLSDVELIVDVLKSLRFYLRLDPDGDAI